LRKRRICGEARGIGGLLATTALALALACCGGASSRPAGAAEETARTLTQGGEARPAPVVHLPSNARQGGRLPLVIALHASGGTPKGFERASGWDRVADAHGFVVAYLGSADPAWKDPSNVVYIAAQIRRLEARYPIDPHRVYVTGFSAGAYITYFVGCRLSLLVTAIAPISGAMAPQRCKPTRPISELTIIGTKDIVPLSGTRRFPAPATVTARWRVIDGCPKSPASTSIVGPTTERVWSPCAQGTAVGFYVIAGGKHAYPGAPGTAGNSPDSRYDASRAAWAFFASHRSSG
jgi:polyhydroxybutyrate depolymerase